MRTYEYIVLLKPDLTDEQIQNDINRIRSKTDDKGRVFSIDFWGKKKLAFEVKGFAKGFYIRFVMAAEPDHIGEIERITRIMPDVMKFLTVKLSDEADIEKLEEQYGAEPKFELRGSESPRSKPEDRSHDSAKGKTETPAGAGDSKTERTSVEDKAAEPVKTPGEEPTPAEEPAAEPAEAAADTEED